MLAAAVIVPSWVLLAFVGGFILLAGVVISAFLFFNRPR